MRRLAMLLVAGTLAAAATSAMPLRALAACEPAKRLGVARIVEIDATGGPVFGRMTRRDREKSFLARGEVVLTFDDGPVPALTRSILDTLDRFCTKATFFAVGRMAIAYPDTVREVLRRGHTLGTHTWSHPMSLPRLGFERARDQIEAGFAAVALAAGRPIAPFFRFPGLNDSEALVAHLERRDVATFTVDVVSNDSHVASPERLVETTLARLEAEGGGILLFHDIKPQTARALPAILARVHERGYKVVHLTARQALAPEPRFVAAVAAQAAERKLVSPKALAALIPRDEAAPSPVPDKGPAVAAPGGFEAVEGPVRPASAPALAAAPPTEAAVGLPLPPLAEGDPARAIRTASSPAATRDDDAATGLPRLLHRRGGPPGAGEPADSRRSSPAEPSAPSPPAPPAAAPTSVAHPEPRPAAGEPQATAATLPPPPAPEQPAASSPGAEPRPARKPQPEVVAGRYGNQAAERARRKSPVPNAAARPGAEWQESYWRRRSDVGN